VHEVREALTRVDNNKVVGSDNIPFEVWKCLGDEGVGRLIKLFNKIMKSKQMSDEWKKDINSDL